MTLTLLLSVRQDFPCSEEHKMIMSDKLTVRREKPFHYGFRQQVPTVGCLIRKKGFRCSFVVINGFGLNMESISLGSDIPILILSPMLLLAALENKAYNWRIIFPS